MRTLTTLPAMALGFVLTGCGTGLSGVAVPPPMDMDRLPPGTSNTALAAPAGFKPQPDIVTRPFTKPAATLYADVLAMAERQPRTFLVTRYDDRLQAHFVARSAVLGFPDLIAIQVLDDRAGHSHLVLWSRSVYGRLDFGVNRRRLEAWLAALPVRPVAGP